MRIGRRQTRQLQQQASRELGCDARTLTITPLSDRVMQVHGCGQLRDYAYATGRRRGWYAIQPVYMRAGSEMACPVQQLSVQAPTSTVRNATGCGRTARYDLVCGAIECAWMMTAHGGAWAGETGAPPGAGSPYGSPYPASGDAVTVTVDPGDGSAPAALPGDGTSAPVPS
nr:hypothetical protein [Myxococcota bacterium]